ncbi:MAG: S8 family serine peptidase [Bacteroidota bacterium]
MKKLFLLSFLSFMFFISCETEMIDETSTLDQSIDLSKSSSNNSFMVISKSETLSKDLEKSLSKIGKVTNTIPEIGIAVVKSDDPNFEKNVAKLAGVRSVVPDLTVNWLEPLDVDPFANPVSIGSDEPFFPYLWGMDAIDAPEAWNEGQTGEGVKVAVLDSGIDPTHPDLAPNINADLSASFVPGEDWAVQPGFYFNHGTHVAGTIAAADNEFGVIGVAPEAEIVAVKVLSEFTGSGSFSGINEGIVYAANINADVINMSLGAAFYKNGQYAQEFIHAQQRAIDYAYKKGVAIITSAGNHNMNADGNRSIIVVPADLNNVISVSATAPFAWAFDQTTNLDEPASYTNTGRSLVDVAAPGGDFDSPYNFWWYDMVLSTIPGGWSWSAGTSMASPHVAGVAALIIGKNGAEMDPHEVEKQLLKSADKIDTNGNSLFYGKGRVNAFRAVTE